MQSTREKNKKAARGKKEEENMENVAILWRLTVDFADFWSRN